MRFPRKEIVEAVRARYPKGTRVELVFMDDPYSRLKPGDRGTVEFVDDIATVHVKWDEKILSVESSVSGGTLIYCGKEYLLEPGKTVTTTK